MDLFNVMTLVREKRPLVQCITNFVTVNDCANILLASGASPTMTKDIREVEDAVSGVNALVCNMGAIEYADSMILAGKHANSLSIPVILDPVAAGATSLRRKTSQKLLSEVHFSVIRGNASEIKALAINGSGGSGVDVSKEDEITSCTLNKTVRLAAKLAQNSGSVIAVSGPVDIVTNGEKTVLIHNGCPTMSRITGSGCMLTALIGGFCAAMPNDIFKAACAAAAVMGISGELAEQKMLKNGTGNATFRNDLIDSVFTLTQKQYEERIRYEIYNG